ncbi:hypothetical protein niasHS_017030 [Heterodera schachtii]|uniref:Protein YIPF n=2 Tax=Heterodera TaxID=34509 RepID=A0ABD2I185_HETSC
MTTNLSFSVDLEQLEKEIQAKEAASKRDNVTDTKVQPDLKGNIGSGTSAQTKRKSNVVGLEEDFDTLDEPIWETINRDLKILYGKFSQVLFPAKSEQNVLTDWDLWGPLFICVALSILLQGADRGAQFTQIFSLAFFGTSFFQALCVIGYCLLPYVFASVAIKSLSLLFWHKSSANLLLRALATVSGFAWALYASTLFLAGSEPPNRRFLFYYPLVLFYFVFSWLVISFA